MPWIEICNNICPDKKTLPYWTKFYCYTLRKGTIKTSTQYFIAMRKYSSSLYSINYKLYRIEHYSAPQQLKTKSHILSYNKNNKLIRRTQKLIDLTCFLSKTLKQILLPDSANEWRSKTGYTPWDKGGAESTGDSAAWNGRYHKFFSCIYLSCYCMHIYAASKFRGKLA